MQFFKIIQISIFQFLNFALLLLILLLQHINLLLQAYLLIPINWLLMFIYFNIKCRWLIAVYWRIKRCLLLFKAILERNLRLFFFLLFEVGIVLVLFMLETVLLFRRTEDVGSFNAALASLAFVEVKIAFELNILVFLVLLGILAVWFLVLLFAVFIYVFECEKLVHFIIYLFSV